ncbi:uncharacterized protein [Venturia canescens]|uniref:uncharacterized protein n=1 Tax=Venturia canescens TaxID=32260 RepID=UPI001C9C302B|nr:uncharacterized protein LOC122411079 [Venturia canescens]
MKSSRNIGRICMRFAASTKQQERSFVRKGIPEETKKPSKKLTKREIRDLFFDNCDGCLTMAAIPHGAFAVRKVRENNERRFLISKMEKRGGNDKESKQDTGYSKKNSQEEGRELTPLKYNSKLMNSIWGLYNRYSVHNFKKNTDADDAMNAATAAAWGPTIRNGPPTKPMIENSAAAQVRQFLGTGNTI